MSKIIYKSKQAFALSELIVVMFIIGVIAAISLSINKPYDRKITLLYNKALNAVTIAAYNVSRDLAGNTFPDTPDGLCEKLANTFSGYINTNSVSCNSNAVSRMANDFPATAIQFITINGMYAYISDRVTKTVTFNGSTYDIPYRIVFFDLNGDKGPNTAQYAADKLPDIVGFIVTDDGDVVPIGYPEIDTRYISARIHLPDQLGVADRYSNTMTYFNAKSSAWGNSFHIDEIKSIDFNDDLPAGSLIKITYPTPPALNTTEGCTLHSIADISPCEVEFNQYIY
jgi:prepilin-type N-terminal cleavage/methylation domain-containing protein